MAYRILPLSDLVINRANDRHGELENETAAIAWLFNNREQHMKNLARDIVATGEIYEPPLVSPEGDKFVVFDGNRRVTCLKVLQEPRRAPNAELQAFFAELRGKWRGSFPDRIQCQVEPDRDRVDDILFRRHTGSQSGVGQSTWDDRMKANFVNRSGKGDAVSVADEIERRLTAANLMPGRRKIPRSTLNRLLSSEAFRNRVGFSINRGRFEFTHEEPVVLNALQRIVDDLAHQRKVLGDIWDVDGKRAYLDELENENLLPTATHSLTKPKSKPAPQPAPNPGVAAPKPTPASPPTRRVNLIARTDYGIAWPGRLQRHRAIWEELQFHLVLASTPTLFLPCSASFWTLQLKTTSIKRASRLARTISSPFVRSKWRKIFIRNPRSMPNTWERSRSFSMQTDSSRRTRCTATFIRQILRLHRTI